VLIIFRKQEVNGSSNH